MTLPRTVSDVVAEHTLFEIEAIDRLLQRRGSHRRQGRLVTGDAVNVAARLEQAAHRS